jgi:hypothetical protein
VFFAIFLFSNIPTFGIKIHLLENILLVAYNGPRLYAGRDFSTTFIAKRCSSNIAKSVKRSTKARLTQNRC